MFYPASGFEMVGKAHLDLAGIHVAQLLVKYAIVLILLSLSSIVVVLYFTLLSQVSLNQKKATFPLVKLVPRNYGALETLASKVINATDPRRTVYESKQRRTAPSQTWLLGCSWPFPWANAFLSEAKRFPTWEHDQRSNQTLQRACPWTP